MLGLLALYKTKSTLWWRFYKQRFWLHWNSYENLS